VEKKEIIYGRNPVLEYLRGLDSPKGAELFISKSAHGGIIDVIADIARGTGVRIEYADKDFFSKLPSSSIHQGVLLKVPRRNKLELDDDGYIDEVREKKGLLVLLDHLTDPHNAGAIIRTVEALGGDGVILPRSGSVSVNPTVVKSSAGATAHVRIITVPNAARFLDTARDAGFWVIGTSDAGDEELDKLRDLRPAIIIIGEEGFGMKRLTAEKCDFVFRIPLRGKIPSLNASVAAGIILYEALKDLG
jgi:23S rRNA (guanosine2251-2'-O)-methyltransferase